ncbi:MAG: PKD domain-containing protein [Ferruginibacter sp.]|nr:PKD domain-containing protein [Ferruginibacter sp.]
MNRILLSAFLLFSGAVQAQRPNKPVAIAGITSTKRFAATKWQEQEPYVNGFARVLQNNYFSFLDKTGNLICPLQFEDARNFVKRLAAVKKADKWGFINEQGKPVVPFLYEIVYDFKENVTPVFNGENWMLIDANGFIVKTLDITACYGFLNGQAKVVKNGQVGGMNVSGEIVYSGQMMATALNSLNRTGASSVVGDCPNNINFENGNFTNWNCFTGNADSVGTTNVIVVTPSAPVPNRHRLINRVLPSAIDAYGLFPTNPPDGSNFAVKLGNTRIGGEAERIQYVIRIPANDSNFSIRYDYAVVFQDPGHTEWTQPRFTAKLFDSAANAYIDCASFEYISTSSLPGFAVSTIDTSVIYKPWASAFISLRGHAGQTLYLEFTTADCVRKGHWGYAYVDVESVCSHAIDMNYACSTGIASLSAPPGFEFYNWWNQTHTSLLGTGQSIVLNPAPPVNSTIWLEMIPFSDFGCRDSMPVQITGSFTPHFDISERVGICAPHSFTFYNRDLPSQSVTWDFGDGQAGIGDTVTHLYTLPGTFIVTMNVNLPGGCNGIFIDSIKILQPTAAFNYTAGNFCGTRDVIFNANVSNVDSLIWNFGDGVILSTDLTSVSHLYSSPGIYIPSLLLISNNGCEITVQGPDTIKIENLVAGFSFTQQRNCGSTTIFLTDTSHAYFGIGLDSWDFGDGQTGVGNNVSHTYATAGNYSIQLIVSTLTGCRDTIVKQAGVSVNNVPVASISGPATGCSSSILTFTGAAQSTDLVNYMAWTASNGSSTSGNSFNVNFAQAGTYTIQLITGTVNGCYDTTAQQVNIIAAPDMSQPADQEVCDGSTVGTIAFSSSISNTNFTWTNDQPSIGFAANGTGNINSFTAANNTALPVIATITVTPGGNSCPGNSRTFTITVNPLPSVIQPADQILCNRGVSQAVIFNNFTNAVNAAINSWTNDSPGIGLAAGGTGNIPSFTAINNGPDPIIATITILSSNNGCEGTPQTFTIIVNPTPNVTPPANHSLCNGEAVNSLHFGGSVSNTVYTWINDNPAIGIPATGSDSIATFYAANNSSASVTANILVTPAANGCQGIAAAFSILVNPTPDVNQPANQSLCAGNPTAVVHFAGSVNGNTYNWENDQPSIGLSANGTGDLLSFNPNNNGNMDVTANITVTPMINGCPGTPLNFSLTILPTPGMIQPLNQFQCNGETTGAMTFMSPVAGTVFNWTNSLPSVGLAAIGTGNIPSFTTMNNTNVAVTAAITVTPSTNNCPGISKTFYISVDPTPAVTQPANQVHCKGEAVTATTLTGSVTGTFFTWINSATAIGLAANGTGDVPSFTAVNNTAFPITAVIQVTGTANSCGSVITVFTITVNPSPIVDPTNDVAVCNGIASPAIPLTGPVSATTYTWKNDIPSIGLPATGAGNIPSFLALNSSGSPVIATIVVFGNNNICTVAIDTFTITVNPSPAVQANNNTNVCLGSPIQLAGTGAAQFSWSPSLGLSCTDCPDPWVTPSDDITYKVKGTSAFGCVAYDSVLLMVRKPFEMLAPPNDTVCAGRSAILNASNANTYVWSPPNGLSNVSIASPTATPTTTTQYRVVGYDAYHCFTDTAYATITVAPQPSVNIGADITSTTGAQISFTPNIQNGPVVQYSWTPASELSCSDCASPTTTVKNNMMFTLSVENSFGCRAVDSIFLTAFCKKAEVFVPNAFTPDGDGLNDILMIRGSGITVKSFRVFNRWGEVIFEKLNFSPNDPKYGWDGKRRGVAATPDVYVYTAEVVCDNGAVYTYKGNTTILK